MNDRVPDSSRLPLRAMVMVLLFLGVVFLLVGLQAVGGDSGGESAPATSATSAAPTTSATPAPRAEVRVFNISDVAGAADRAAGRLRDDGWTVTETGNLAAPPNVTATTVYFGEAEGEKQSAEAVGKLLDAPVEPRIPEVAEQPPGVVVLVTG
ncbi:MAG TPA: LytR C-terminal domain-containing protein [Mycobacterium sp.]|nr:LytR C-terminal domain-containing protein [Mycobacterium sp.]